MSSHPEPPRGWEDHETGQWGMGGLVMDQAAYRIPRLRLLAPARGLIVMLPHIPDCLSFFFFYFYY